MAIVLTSAMAIFGVLSGSNYIIVFVWLELFCINYSCFGALLSIFINGKKLAFFLSTLIYILTWAVPVGLRIKAHFSELVDVSGLTEPWHQWLMSLFGPSNFAISTIWLYDRGATGALSWDGINTVHEAKWNHISFADCLVMLCFDSLLYILLTAYFERVWPSTYGQREHPLFFLFPSYWNPKEQIAESEGANSNVQMAENIGTSGMTTNGTMTDNNVPGTEKSEEILMFEPPPNGRKLVEIQNLKKHFGSVHAVDGVTLDIMEGEVLCLLGHNGAGKTTTIGMLTGTVFTFILPFSI